MTEPITDKRLAKVVEVLKDSFGPSVEFELRKDSETVYTVKARAADNASLTDGIENIKLAKMRGGAVTVLSDDDADDYAQRSLDASDPVVRAGYEQLAREARGQ
jgi:hypothetical protein